MSDLQKFRPAANSDGGDDTKVKAFFEGISGQYSEFFDSSTRSGAAYLFQLRCQLGLELLSGEKHQTLLDVATGTGEITHAIASSYGFEEVHLNDISPGMLNSCRSLFGDGMVRTVVCTNQDVFQMLETKEASKFDVVLCLGLIAHTGRLAELLAKMYTCLRPGGILLLQSSLTDNLGTRVAVSYARSPLRRMGHKVSAFSKSKILTLAAAAGFEIEKVRRYGVCLPFGDRILGKMNYKLEAAFAHKLVNSGGEALFKLRKPA